MKKVLVTGGCGFLGSHVCELFKEKGWNVIAYDNLTKFEYSRVPYFDIEQVRDYNLQLLEWKGIPVIIDDIRNQKMLMKAANGCDLICHCAAQPAMTIAIENPELDFDVNVGVILNTLEVCRQKNIPMVNCSTIHVYGNGINKYLTEDEDKFQLKRYRQDNEVKAWMKKGPILRLEKYMKSKKLLDDNYKKQVLQKAKEKVEKEVQIFENMPPQDPQDIFRYEFAEMTPELKEQSEEIK